jgi:Ca2+:H+ antiporter
VLAIEKGLPDVVRGSITGSVVSNLLLVLGLTMVAGSGDLDRRSLLTQLAVIGVAAAVLLVPSIPGWDHDPDRHSLFIASIPVAVVLLAAYVVTTVLALRRHGAMETPEASESAWSMKTAIIVLAVSATATAFVSEALVGSLEGFGHALGWSDFFIAAVIVAIVGNAAEHGGAIVVASRGRTKLASEIAISSAAQVAVFVAPAAALISIATSHDLTLAFRPVELATIALATLAVTLVVIDGRSSRGEGIALVVGYGGAVAAYALLA